MLALNRDKKTVRKLLDGMDPVAFDIFGWPIHWYGVAVAGGFLACLIHWNLTVQWEGFPKGFGSEMGFWIMFSSIVGARVAYVVANLDRYTGAPFDIFRLWEGGLIYYGGLILASLSVLVIALRMKKSPWAMGDYAICPIPLGHAIGRLGCFLNGCCYGKPADLPWCQVVNEVCRHPTPLYEAAINVLLYGALVWFYPRKKRDGRVFALYLILYPLGRFVIEFFRGDERIRWLGLTVAQELSLVMLMAGVVLWFVLPARRPATGGQDV